MLAARTAAKPRTRKKDRCAFITRPVQDEIRVGFFAGEIAPIIEQHFAIALLGLKLQELLRHHLIGVHVHPVQRKNQSSVFGKRLHLLSVISLRYFVQISTEIFSKVMRAAALSGFSSSTRGL